MHKWFPIVVRYPWLMPIVPRAIKIKWMARPYLIMYMLYAEFLASVITQIRPVMVT